MLAPRQISLSLRLLDSYSIFLFFFDRVLSDISVFEDKTGDCVDCRSGTHREMRRREMQLLIDKLYVTTSWLKIGMCVVGGMKIQIKCAIDMSNSLNDDTIAPVQSREVLIALSLRVNFLIGSLVHVNCPHNFYCYNILDMLLRFVKSTANLSERGRIFAVKT
jgi:hypothetical protein